MAQIYDISMKITNELPKLTITQDLTVTINNRKSTILNIQAMIKEGEKKKADGEDVDDISFMNKALGMLIGEKNAAEIESMDLPLPEYKELFNDIMAIASGTYGETPTK